MRSTIKTTWTRQDEQEFQLLQARREKIMANNKRPVWELAAKLELVTPHTCSYLQEFLIQHADSIRDALAPFDSGARPAPVVADISEGGHPD